MAVAGEGIIAFKLLNVVRPWQQRQCGGVCFWYLAALPVGSGQCERGDRHRIVLIAHTQQRIFQPIGVKTQRSGVDTEFAVKVLVGGQSLDSGCQRAEAADLFDTARRDAIGQNEAIHNKLQRPVMQVLITEIVQGQTKTAVLFVL